MAPNKLKYSIIIILLNIISINSERTKDELDDALSILGFNDTQKVEFKSEGRLYKNGTFRTGYQLWDDILNQCTVDPSVSCLQKNFYTFLEDKVGLEGDVNVTEGVCLKRNGVDYKKYSKEANAIYLRGSAKDDVEESRSFEQDNEIKDDYDSETPFEEVTDAMYDKSVHFLMTHDLRLTLPEMFFHGATLKLSPRALTTSGALLHVDIQPKNNEAGDPRIFFKKIKKYFQKKLLMAALAIILVIKLIKLKLLFILPLIIGMGAAKKLFLKLILFMFPALGHIFKLCSWYHNNYHTTKYHHHHHLISHHHHKTPTPVYHPGPQLAYGGHHETHQGGHHETHQGGHHGSGHAVVHHDPGSLHQHYGQDWELSGPGLGSEYLASSASGIHRNAIANFKPHADDANDINSWGLGMPPGSSAVSEAGYTPSLGTVSLAPAASSPHPGKTAFAAGQPRPVGPPIGSPMNRIRRPYKELTPQQAEKEALLRAAALAARAPASPVRDEVLRVTNAQLAERQRAQAEKQLVRNQQLILDATDPDTIAAEKFYGPLVDRVEKILVPLGARDQGCRERAVCALYRDPVQHTPYSNLVSNELSKDSSELQPPAGSKSALRYYNYVQAARDGQEQRDCLAMYPQCDIDFHKK